MDSGTLIYNTNISNENGGNLAFQKRALLENAKVNKSFKDISDRDREDFLSFLDQQGLVNETGILVIPSTRHFFYDAEDLKGVKTVINLKLLNHIREMREFLKTISDLMPQKSTFVGCFVDNRTQNGFSDKYNNLPGNSQKDEAYENGIESRIPFINRMYSFIDSRTNRYLTRRSVITLLEECGLKVVEMTELNGTTYFCTRKSRPAA
jgi:hypothetical protein